MMRIPDRLLPGPAPRGKDVTITVDGQPLTARQGEPVLLALLAHGLSHCRTMPGSGAPRGLFCGVGRCPDCAMIVDGVPNVRTCVTPVQPGLLVETQLGLGSWRDAGALPHPVDRWLIYEHAVASGSVPDPAPQAALEQSAAQLAGETRTVPLAIVGAGPAGLAAALAAAHAGCQVVLLDEWPAPGGRLRRQLAPVGAGPCGVELAPRLTARLLDAGVEVLSGVAVWGLFPANALGVTRGADPAFLLRAATLVLATGGTDAAVSFPGWTLPGVMLASAVEQAIAIHRVLPGRRFLVVGGGPDAAQAAATIHAGGGEVIATVPPKAVVAARGTGRVTSVALADSVGTGGPLRIIAVDSICLAVGRNPDYTLALQAGVELTYDSAAGCHLPARDASGLTSVPGLYIAGDVAGVGGVEAALLDGARVGLAAAGGDPDGGVALVARLLRDLAKAREATAAPG